LRVIAGKAKGHPLRSIESRSVRPTSDKVKGAIFSMLEAEAYKRGLAEPGYLLDVEEGGGGFPWPRVLDLYAGSGALGIEALSRGAEWVDFVEADAKAREIIAENLRRTGLTGRSRIHAMRVETAVSTIAQPYDLILLDPPYGEPDLELIFRQLCESALVGVSTFIVIEHSRERGVPSHCGPLRLLKTRVHGGTGISIYAAG
jgi:16S rRNA (guanine966-N2)-methyltransferase